VEVLSNEQAKQMNATACCCCISLASQAHHTTIRLIQLFGIAVLIAVFATLFVVSATATVVGSSNNPNNPNNNNQQQWAPRRRAASMGSSNSKRIVLETSIRLDQLNSFIAAESWKAEWQFLQQELHELHSAPEYSTRISTHENNANKNRYTSSFTLDRTRVKLQQLQPQPTLDEQIQQLQLYHNANSSEAARQRQRRRMVQRSGGGVGSTSSDNDEQYDDDVDDDQDDNDEQYDNDEYDNDSGVVLANCPYHTITDYINANWVSSALQPKAYIAAQAPLPATFAEFWQCCWEQRVSLVVMLTNLVEGSMRKAHQYWPDDTYANRQLQYGSLQVRLESEAVDDTVAAITTRVFTMTFNGDSRTITQKHFTAWPGQNASHALATCQPTVGLHEHY
jgi:protein tyrosine phosphatase